MVFFPWEKRRGVRSLFMRARARQLLLLACGVAAFVGLRAPRDAWGRPLRVTCPGRKDTRGFDVSSDGPDGEPGGLDRVE